MRLLMMKNQNKKQIGIEDEKKEKVLQLASAYQALKPEAECPHDIEAIIAGGEKAYQEVKDIYQKAQKKMDEGYWIDQKELTLLPPVSKPPKNIMCVGKNYAAHAIEMGSKADIPEHPLIFTKPQTSIAASDQEIDLHSHVSDQIDYEGELAVIIGKEGKKIGKEEAWDYVFGYTLMNDITARDLQVRHKQFYLGKSLDDFAPLGPVLVTREDAGQLLNDTLTTKVNGETRQSAPLEDMIFDIPELIHIISQGMSLEPGDIIATGTPSGVGKGMNPPQFLKSGDEVTITIPTIGTLKNTMVDK